MRVRQKDMQENEVAERMETQDYAAEREEVERELAQADYLLSQSSTPGLKREEIISQVGMLKQRLAVYQGIAVAQEEAVKDETAVEFSPEYSAANIILEVEHPEQGIREIRFDSWEEASRQCMHKAHMAGAELDEMSTPKDTVLTFYQGFCTRVEIKQDTTSEAAKASPSGEPSTPSWQDETWGDHVASTPCPQPHTAEIPPEPTAFADPAFSEQVHSIEVPPEQASHKNGASPAPPRPLAHMPSQPSSHAGTAQSHLAETITAGTAAVLGAAQACLVGLVQGAKQLLMQSQAAAQSQAQTSEGRPSSAPSSIVPSREEFEQAFSLERQQRLYRWQRAQDHCVQLESRMLMAEKLCDDLAENPIVKGYVERMRMQQDHLDLRNDFYRTLDDPLNPYGAKAKDDMAQLFSCLRDVKRDLPMVGSSCAKIQATERFEERTAAFLADMSKRPEASLLRDEADTSLKDKAAEMMSVLRATLEKVRETFRNFFRRDDSDDEHDVAAPSPA